MVDQPRDRNLGPRRATTEGGYSQEEVARIFGCTRSNVHLIEKRALRKLRDGLAGVAAELGYPVDREEPNRG